MPGGLAKSNRILTLEDDPEGRKGKLVYAPGAPFSR